MDDILDATANALPQLLTLISAFAGAIAALLGVLLTARLQRKRELRVAQGDAIVELIRAWGEAYRRAVQRDFEGYEVEVESSVASARLLLLVRKKDVRDISAITSITTNMINQESAQGLIAVAQDALMHWHTTRCSGTAALQRFKNTADRIGLKLPH